MEKLTLIGKPGPTAPLANRDKCPDCHGTGESTRGSVNLQCCGRCFGDGVLDAGFEADRNRRNTEGL